MMEIRIKSDEIDKIIRGAEFLGSGASKEAFYKDGKVYKIPRGRYLIENNDGINHIPFPSSMEEINTFLEDVNCYEGALVWPLGQFATELVIWKAIETLRNEGLDVSCFAEILDYYFDGNGVIVIEQEYTQSHNDDDDYYDEDEEWGIENEEAEKRDELMSDLRTELKLLEPIFEERFGIRLRDVREGNCGIKDGRMKLFDFGISTTTDLDSYDGYSW